MNNNSGLLEWLEFTKQYGSKPGLESIKKLLSLLDNPQNNYDSIHITGTNGKGSTTAITTSILEAAGYSVGTFTSPHLSKINESIKVNGIEISDTEMSLILSEIKNEITQMTEDGIRHPTHFEILVALAYTYFKSRNIDIAVIEVGMGGKHDATNVIESMASIVTNISLEHTKWLGNSPEEIAENKAGILRPNTVLITAATQPTVLNILREVAHNKTSQLIQVDKEYKIFPETHSLDGQGFTLKTPYTTLNHLTIPLLGYHQLRNTACAIAAIDEAKQKGYTISEDHIRSGLETVAWPGRFEIIDTKPKLILDGAKDAAAIHALVETVENYLPGKKTITLLGISSDKAHQDMITSLAKITHHFILTEHRIKSRKTPAEDLQRLAENTGVSNEIVIPIEAAIKRSYQIADQEDIILITGSVFLIGEAREYLVQ